MKPQKKEQEWHINDFKEDLLKYFHTEESEEGQEEFAASRN